MSGNRNKVLTAVRLRKENQVYSAEERRELLQLHQEERLKRENTVLGDFRKLIEEKFGSELLAKVAPRPRPAVLTPAQEAEANALATKKRKP